jgi:D-amino peptidase
MKLYISADIEGVAGITHWNEATKSNGEYPEFRGLMTDEVIAACKGALGAGVDDILIKDAHGTGRNIITDKLPRQARIIRGWSGHPFSMMQELDNSFDAAIMTGYHSPASSGGNPLAHTISGSFHQIILNGQVTSEFMLNSYMAAYHKVPVIFISGDEALCEAAQEFILGIECVATQQGIGDSTISITPEVSRECIEASVEKAVQNIGNASPIILPEHFELEMHFQKHQSAYHGSFYPGARLISDTCVGFKSNDFFEIARIMSFMN